jgi:hypothetical protein
VIALCKPVDKSGAPVFLAGEEKGAPKPIAPAVIRNPDGNLLCYRVRIARKIVPQNGCGPVDPATKGTKIVPPQPGDISLSGINTGNQFGQEQIDMKRALALCIPSLQDP